MSKWPLQVLTAGLELIPVVTGAARYSGASSVTNPWPSVEPCLKTHGTFVGA